ncbi:MAG: hypothetical protein J7L14_03475 [Candidatus Diapherotrites archaeon]|nr:hypothetical protein [Candidatus Diapherotrites archaeon]
MRKDKFWRFILLAICGYASGRATANFIQLNFKSALFHSLAALIFLLLYIHERQQAMRTSSEGDFTSNE